MAITFTSVPSTNKIPRTFLEFQAQRRAAASTFTRPTLLCGQMTSAGTATAGTRYRTTSWAQAKALFGQGSVAAGMAKAYLGNDPNGELYIVPVADASGTNATATIQVTAASTAAGTISLYIAGVLVEVAIASGTSADDTATAIDTAIKASPHYADMPCTSGVSTDTVTLTAKHDGTVGNQLDVRVNYLGADAGETLPAGTTLSITNFASGATDPSTNGSDYVDTEEFHFYCDALSTTTVLNDYKTLIDAFWEPTDQRFGQFFGATQDSVANLLTLGAGRNAKHETILGLTGSPTPDYEIAAAMCGACARILRDNPALPVTRQPLVGVLAPASSARHTYANRQALLGGGIATVTVGRDGTVYVERAITTYQEDAGGSPDETWLDSQTSATLTRIGLRIAAVLDNLVTYSLVSDTTTVGAGVKAISPAGIKGLIIADAAIMVEQGLIEDLDAFKASIVVERNSSDPNRVDVAIVPDLANQVRTIAVAVQFGV